jgi:hypothetical protein
MFMKNERIKIIWGGVKEMIYFIWQTGQKKYLIHACPAEHGVILSKKVPKRRP